MQCRPPTVRQVTVVAMQQAKKIRSLVRDYWMVLFFIVVDDVVLMLMLWFSQFMSGQLKSSVGTCNVFSR